MINTTRHAQEKWLKRFLRFGLLAKGVVYCLLGIIAVMAAVGLSNRDANKADAFKMIYDQPFGKIILALLIVGLLGYVTLRLIQCFKDTDGKGKDARGMITRIGYAISALIYFSLAIYAGKLLINGAGGGDSRQFFVSKILAMPAGEWIVGLAGAIIIANGINQLIKGVSGKFMKKVSLIRSNLNNLFKKAGTIGYISRGVVLGIIGYFLFHAALTSNPSEAQGTDKAFDFVENNFGSVMMAIVALGLVGYGVFMFVRAKYESLNIRM